MIEETEQFHKLVQSRRDRLLKVVESPSLPDQTTASQRERTRRDLQFLCELGAAMSSAGDATTFIRRDLERIGQRFGLPNFQASVGPTLLLLRYGHDDVAVVDLMTITAGNLTISKVAGVYELASEAESGAIDSEEGLRRLREVLSAPQPARVLVRALGISLIAAAVGLLLGATAEVLLVCCFLGALVGLIKVGSEAWPKLWPFIPVLAGGVAASVAFAVVSSGSSISVADVLVPSLAVFLPGAAISVALIELSSGDIVSGGSRLAFAAVRLLLLLFGIVIAEQLIGWRSVDGTGIDKPALVVQTIGIFLFTIGIALHYQAERERLPWLLLVVVAAWGSQQIVGDVLGPYIGAAAGATAIVLVSRVIETRTTVNPLVLTYTPAFWLLVPGSLGLQGVEQLARSDVNAAIGTLMVMLLTMLAIALGILLGLAVQGSPRVQDAILSLSPSADQRG